MTIYEGHLKLAANFALRIVCAGVTQCGVERVFSHIKWILGTRRYQLGVDSIRDLIILRNSYNISPDLIKDKKI